MDEVKGVVAVSSDDGKCGDDHDWYEHDADNGSGGKCEPTVRTDLFHLFPCVEGVVRVEGSINALCRSIGDVRRKEGLEQCQSRDFRGRTYALYIHSRASRV